MTPRNGVGKTRAEETPSFFQKLNYHALRPAIYRNLNNSQLLLAKFSVHQGHFVKVQLCLTSCRHAHLIWYHLL